MRFLVDNSISPRMASGLRAAGHDAVHVRDLALASADDEIIFSRAGDEDRIIVAGDTDFSTLLAIHGKHKPSVIIFRCRFKSVDRLLPLLSTNLRGMKADLEAGAIAIIEDSRIRIRGLPL